MRAQSASTLNMSQFRRRSGLGGSYVCIMVAHGQAEVAAQVTEKKLSFGPCLVLDYPGQLLFAEWTSCKKTAPREDLSAFRLADLCKDM